MVGTFACPECGAVVKPPTSAAGRQVRCRRCGTLVEVPFFVRKITPGRRRPWYRRRQFRAALGLVTSLLVVAVGLTVVRARLRADRLRELDARVASADSAEARGLLEPALAALDEALKLADRAGPGAADRAEALAARRATLAASLDRERRAERGRAARADLDAARRARDAGRAAEALAACERAVVLAPDGPPEAADATRAAAREIATALVSARGVTLDPVSGAFLPNGGTAAAHAASLHPIVAGALAGRGYLPFSAASPVRDLWSGNAPYHLTIQLDESHRGTYMQSALPKAHLDARFALLRDAELLWHTALTARTRDPSPRLPTMEAAALATSRRRDPDAERKLYDDAVSVLLESLPARLSNLPPWGAGG